MSHTDGNKAAMTSSLKFCHRIHNKEQLALRKQYFSHKNIALKIIKAISKILSYYNRTWGGSTESLTGYYSHLLDYKFLLYLDSLFHVCYFSRFPVTTSNLDQS